MSSRRYIIISVFLAAGFVMVGPWGCAHKQAMNNQGEINSAAPSKSVEKAPAAATQENTMEKRTVAEAPPGPKEQPEPVETGRVEKSVKDIYFAFDKYDIRPTEEKILDEDYQWVKNNKPGLVLIEGNCDERGTVEYNLALGERRAEAAKRYLVALGIDRNKLKTISYGKSKPVDPGHDEAAWAKNRRDHFVVE